MKPSGRLPILSALQACNYLPKQQASLLLGWLQITLLGDRSTLV